MNEWNVPSIEYISRNCVKASKKNPLARHIEWAANDLPCKSLSSGISKYNTAVVSKKGTDNNIQQANSRACVRFTLNSISSKLQTIAVKTFSPLSISKQ